MVQLMKEYALYHGDNFIDLGTVAYLSKKQGISENSIRFYRSPTYRKRTKDKGYILIALEEEE